MPRPRLTPTWLLLLAAGLAACAAPASEDPPADVNSAPIANHDVMTVGEDGPALVLDVLANDSDPDGDALSVVSIDDSGVRGIVTWVEGVITYNPNGLFDTVPSGEEQADFFDYTIKDEAGETATATVVVRVAGVNDLPVCAGALDSTIYVDAALQATGDGGSVAAAYKTVTEAVAAAPANGRLCIAPGTYAEAATLVLDKDLTLEGGTEVDASGTEVVLDGQDSHRVLRVIGIPTITLRNLTVTRGNSGVEDGGGISNDGLLTLLDVVVTGNRSEVHGGGIDNDGTTILGAGTQVSNNTAANGGGIFTSGGLTLAAGVLITGNTASNLGGGIYYRFSPVSGDLDGVTGNEPDDIYPPPP